PGGRPVSDASARVDVAAAWGVGSLPTMPGRDVTEIIDAALGGQLEALVIGGVDPADLPDPATASAAIEKVPFVVSIELRESEVTRRADVVFPVAAAAEKPGTYIDWEGRPRPFDAALRDTGAKPDLYTLAGLADELGASLGFSTVAAA